MGYSEPGMVMTASSAAETLRKKKPFANAYNTIQNQYKSNVSAIEQNFDLTRNQLAIGYGTDKFNLGKNFVQEGQDLSTQLSANREITMDSSFGSGYRKQLQNDFRSVAANAYDSYISNYMNNTKALDTQHQNDVASAYSTKMSQLNTAQENAQSQIDATNEVLMGEAKNYADLYNAPMQYLQYLAETKDKNGNLLIDASNPTFGKFFNTTYVDGEPVTTLKTNEELEAMFYEYDGNGNITGLSQTGVDFYTQMLFGGNDTGVSFNAWLSGTNSDLYDWMQQGNSYEAGKTNLEAVFGQVSDELGKAVTTGKYKGDSSDAYTVKPTETAKAGAYGTMEKYRYGDSTVTKVKGLGIKGANAEQIINGKNEAFRLEDRTGNDILVKVKKDEVVSDDIINAIVKSEGTVGNQEIHEYNGEFYISLIDDDGKTHFKHLNISSDKEKDLLEDAVKNPQAHQDAAETYAKSQSEISSSNYDYSSNAFNPLDWIVSGELWKQVSDYMNKVARGG